MRTLTQVWFIHAGISFIFLLLCFKLLGRGGLFIALAICLIFLYAALRKNIDFLWGPLGSRSLIGNDTSGLLQSLNLRKGEFGFKKVEVYITDKHTPPLVWKNTENEGRIILNRALIENLNTSEIKLLSVFLLSHLQTRSFVLPQFLSSVHWSTAVISFFTRVFAASMNKIVQKPHEIFAADLKFLSASQTTPFEAGYFLNKLHQFGFNKAKPNHFFYFSTLSMRPILNEEFGLPYLHVRLHRMMGFSI